MPRPSKTHSLPARLAAHLAMGGLLGTALAVSLIVMNARNILDLIALSASPWMTGMVFVSIFALFCAVGATLTGLIFIMAEEDDA
jgi:O-antigen ligase